VEFQAAGEAVVLWRPEAGDRIPGVWIPGRGRAALVVHPDGAEGARGTAAAQDRIRAGRPVLLIDAFQTGKARAPRDTSHQHFLTFNLTDDAHRVQDILTAAAFLRSRQPGAVEVVGLNRAGLWALFAAALSPPEISLAADLDWFEGSEDDFLRYFPVPGIRRAGGLGAALFLTEGRRRRD
jgi:hypothetical protein